MIEKVIHSGKSHFHMILLAYFTDNPAWISSSKTIGWNISCHNASRSNHTPFSYGNTTANNHIRCQPAIIFYRNCSNSLSVGSYSSPFIIFSLSVIPYTSFLFSITCLNYVLLNKCYGTCTFHSITKKS